MKIWGTDLVESDRVVDTNPHEQGHEGIPGDFNDNLRKHKHLPAVRLGGALAHFVERTLSHKVRHLLLDELTENTHQIEDGEHLVLEALDRLGGVEEDETDEERHGAAEDQLGVDVGWRAPVLLEHAARDDLKLAPERRGKLLDGLRLGRAAGRRAGQGARLEVLQLGLHRLVLLALEPCLVPVDLGGGAGGGANGGKHPFGRVLSVVAGRRSILLEVVDQGLRVLTNVAKVDRSSTLGQEKQAIEPLEQHGGRLVNGTKDGLAGLGKLFEEVENSP